MSTMSDEAFDRLYGPWEPLTIDEVAELLRGFDAPWWIVGGHAIDAFTEVAREHHDIDIAVLARDLPALRSRLAPRFQTWSAGSGLLRPLDTEHPEMHPEAGQVWVREHALAPWKADFIVLDDRDGAWVWKHDPSVTWSLADSTWMRDDGIRFAKPEIVLAFKARRLEERNDIDFTTTWPKLDGPARTWLSDTVERLYPGHPWLDRIAAPDGPVEIDGQTVRLREATLDDAGVLDGRAGNPAMIGEFNDFGLPRPRPLADNLVHGKRMVSRERGLLLIERLDDGAVIGDVGWHQVTYGPNEPSRALNIGLSLDPEARGHGHGTEAQRLLAQLLFRCFDVERIEASTDIENVAEQRSLEKAGFTREGVLRHAQSRAGTYHDLVSYSILREDL
jgi:RimJ/RimL family protein N-acetyltransferase